MILYELAVLSLISICEEDIFDDLYLDLVTDALNYDSSKFEQQLKTLQDQFECLGIKCSQAGKSKFSTDSWPECEEYPENLKFA